MTDSQRRWEAWFAAFSRVHAAWPDQVDVPCPNGDGGRVRVAYIGDPARRIGMAFAWCDTCRQGIYLSRVGIPEGAPMLAFGVSEADQAAVIPPDLELLDPDPAPPDDEDDDEAQG
jgi:hypothetical protein